MSVPKGADSLPADLRSSETLAYVQQAIQVSMKGQNTVRRCHSAEHQKRWKRRSRSPGSINTSDCQALHRDTVSISQDKTQSRARVGERGGQETEREGRGEAEMEKQKNNTKNKKRHSNKVGQSDIATAASEQRNEVTCVTAGAAPLEGGQSEALLHSSVRAVTSFSILFKMGPCVFQAFVGLLCYTTPLPISIWIPG